MGMSTVYTQFTRENLQLTTEIQKEKYSKNSTRN